MDRIGGISAYARKSAAASNRTQLVDVIQSINTYLGFFLRPEGHWSGLSDKGSYRVRLHHQKPCNRRVTHAVGGCKCGKSGRACHAFHRAVVHRVPNDPLFVLLPDFVAHLDPTFSGNLIDGADMPLRRRTGAVLGRWKIMIHACGGEGAGTYKNVRHVEILYREPP